MHQDRQRVASEEIDQNKKAGRQPRLISVCECCSAFEVVTLILPKKEGGNEERRKYYCLVDRRGMHCKPTGKGFYWKEVATDVTVDGFEKEGVPDECIMKMEQVVVYERDQQRLLQNSGCVQNSNAGRY